MRRRKPVPILSWQQAENAAADWMRSWGFRDAEPTRSGSDAGLDVVSRKAVAQVKFRAQATPRTDLQNLHGARARATRKKLLFFSLAGYSPQAIAYANEVDMALFQYGRDGRVRAVNPAAQKVKSSRPSFTSRVREYMPETVEPSKPGSAFTPDVAAAAGHPGSPSSLVTRAVPAHVTRPPGTGAAWFGRNWRWAIGILLFGAAIAGLGNQDNFHGPWYADLGTILFAIVLMIAGVLLVGWHLVRQEPAQPQRRSSSGSAIPARYLGQQEAPPRRRGLPDEDFDL